MNSEEIRDYLSPIERSVLELLSGKFVNIDSLVSEDLARVTIVRALGLLSSKGLVEQKQDSSQQIELGILGVHYLKKDLPERVLLDALIAQKSIIMGELRNVTGLNENEVKVAVGTLKRRGALDIDSGRVVLRVGFDSGSQFDDEVFLKSLPRSYDSLSKSEQRVFSELLKRKDIVELVESSVLSVALTSLGKDVLHSGLRDDLLEQVTPKLIRQQGWKGKRFRRYDVNAVSPRTFSGKRHFVAQATDYARSIWLEMGFNEMQGPMVLSGLYNFDALFTAQDHPVREEQDTFYLKGKVTRLEDKKFMLAVRKAHEGGINGSVGWQGNWTENEASKVVLRTHTTPLSIMTMQRIAKDGSVPAKYFSLGKCFRNETVDWSHGFEFNQTEGIVVDEGANFRQLLGYLKTFFGKMGYEKLRVRPAYFPYTEPSVEIDVWVEAKGKWLELGGAGMFRPEVTVPIFGKHIPVLAWGPGFDRTIMEYFAITDLRDMYKNDISQLREMKYWRKKG